MTTLRKILQLNKNMEKSDLTGTTPGAVFSVSFFVPLSSFLIWLISNVFSLSIRFSTYTEVFVLNLVLLLTLTLFNDYISFSLGVLCLLTLILLFTKVKSLSSEEVNSITKLVRLGRVSDKDFNRMIVGDYRAHLLLATSICILAVDFKIFPNRFSKTETYGWSVMDAGVGSFVMLHGVCSSHGKMQLQRDSFRKCFISSLKLFLVGLIRLALTTAVGYHKAVSEYGLHWNFFFTLAFTKIFCYAVSTQLKIKSGLLVMVTMIAHQLLLSKAGLTEVVMSDFRRNFFEANKEGISSLLGFASLYFCGVEIGHIVWKHRYEVEECFLLLIKLCAIGLSGWFLMYLSHVYIQPCSRRMANLTYCIWVVSLTNLQIAVHVFHRLVLFLLEKNFKIWYDNLLWKVINYNGLFYFLLANILTGFINISINTDNVSKLTAFVILIVYCIALFVSSLIIFKLKNKSFNL